MTKMMVQLVEAVLTEPEKGSSSSDGKKGVEIENAVEICMVD